MNARDLAFHAGIHMEFDGDHVDNSKNCFDYIFKIMPDNYFLRFF